MGNDSFTITVEGDMTAAMEKIRGAVKGLGGSFDGDATSGTFSGQTPVGLIYGEYRISGSEVKITITKKPAFLPGGMIESKIREFFK